MSDLTVQLRHAKRNNETKLDLSCKNISFIPNEIYGLTNLEILNLSKNRISSIDSKIESLVNLKSLDLSDNSLMEVPSEIMRLPKLQVFAVGGNPLIKKFEPLQGKECVGPALQRTPQGLFWVRDRRGDSCQQAVLARD
jgi:Leucine-rich repeat (LRR) protein